VKIVIVPTPGLSGAGFYTTGIHTVSLQSPVLPTPTIATLSKLPGYRMLPLFERKMSVRWHRTSDPEDKTMTDTTVAAPIIGGILMYIGAAAPTLSVPYMTLIHTAMVTCRGRKL